MRILQIAGEPGRTDGLPTCGIRPSVGNLHFIDVEEPDPEAESILSGFNRPDGQRFRIRPQGVSNKRGLSMRTLKIGILDLVAKGPTRTFFARTMHANFASIMPQTIAVWCEEEDML